jgi:hypothetical protein
LALKAVPTLALTLTRSLGEKGQESSASIFSGVRPATSTTQFFEKLYAILSLPLAAGVREHVEAGAGRGERELG